MNTLPNLLNRYMSEHGLKSRDMAEILKKHGLEVSHATVANWQKGKGVKDDNLYKLSDFFNVTFYINPNEQTIKYKDYTTDISSEIQSMPYTEEDKEFLNDKNFRRFFLVAKLAAKFKEQGAFDNMTVKEFAKEFGLMK